MQIHLELLGNSIVFEIAIDMLASKLPTASLQLRIRKKITSLTSSSSSSSSSKIILVSYLAIARMAKRSAMANKQVKIRIVTMTIPILPLLHLFCHY
jgi:hypothetical protein